MKTWRDQVSFVLVEPKEAGNIGSAARAIKNMGFSRLRLVRPPAVLTDEARWFACNALDVLEHAEVFASVGEAVRDASVVVGTTRRMGKRRGLVLPVDRGAERLYRIAEKSSVVILFGRESRGLFNEEIDSCGFLLNIPSSRSQPSLNLAHAVLIVAYELSRCVYGARQQARKGQGDEPEHDLAVKLVSQADANRLFDRMTQTLKQLDYIPRGDRDLEERIMRNLRHFIGRAGLTEWELNMLHGICSQIEGKLERLSDQAID